MNLDLTPEQAARLKDILDHSFATSVNHLVSSARCIADNPTSDWANGAPRLADIVETDRMLKLKLSRALAPEEPAPIAPGKIQHPNLADFPREAEVVVQFEVSMYVHVDLVTGLPTRTIVQTPNVSSMSEQLTDCMYYGPDVPDSLHRPARWGRQATDEEHTAAIKILDANCWPAPELVS